MESSTYQRLPKHLQAYVAVQDYDRYTWRDQATWRFIMRRAKRFLDDHAHSSYKDGLAAVGLSESSIPKISDMDSALAEFGWGAVCVCGFIPPLAFIEFQACAVLPIAVDIRTLEHINYTPAPDIVHEAAGHGPILADPAYRDFLRQYAKVARQAIFSRRDIALYEAIRELSDLKENPDISPDEVLAAEERLIDLQDEEHETSEASRVARLFWWTVEYGLVKGGKDDGLLLYGAGLLSSLAEARTCYDESVEKIPLSLACTDQDYDITRPQPQLFVADTLEHLANILGELAATLAFRRGGMYGLETASQAETVTTVVLDSGLGISGVLMTYGELFIWTGPVQLSYLEEELEGFGTARYRDGLIAQLGPWLHSGQEVAKPYRLDAGGLATFGLEVGKYGELSWVDGASIKGKLDQAVYRDGKLLLLCWSDGCLEMAGIILRSGNIDVLVGGESFPVVSGGPADIGTFGDYDFGQAQTSPGRTSAPSAREVSLYSLYGEVRRLRKQKQVQGDELWSLSKIIAKEFAEEWLLVLELWELADELSAVLAPEFEEVFSSWNGRVGEEADLFRSGLEF